MTAIDERATRPAPDVNADLGFGSVVARESRQRFLNRDGSFNVRRVGLRFWESLSVYHHLLTVTWKRFFTYVGLYFIVANTLFASAFVAAGPGSLTGSEGLTTVGQRFLQAFFFSIHTLATIGYGNVAPVTLAANILVAIESLTGLIAVAVIAGLSFARFSRPVADIIFSRNAIVAPYRGITALMFRIANRKDNQLVDMTAKVLLTRRKPGGGLTEREFLQLTLERDRVVFFPLSWTIVHPIDEQSPLWNVSEAELRASDPEILILLYGFDETFSQTVHARSSYRGDEFLWNARFRSMFRPPDERGVISVDIQLLHEIDRS